MDNKLHEISSRLFYLQERYTKLLDKIEAIKKEGDETENEMMRCKAELKAYEEQHHAKFFGHNKDSK